MLYYNALLYRITYNYRMEEEIMIERAHVRKLVFHFLSLALASFVIIHWAVHLSFVLFSVHIIFNKKLNKPTNQQRRSKRFFKKYANLGDIRSTTNCKVLPVSFYFLRQHKEKEIRLRRGRSGPHGESRHFWVNNK